MLRFKKGLGLGKEVDFLTVGEEGGQFLGRIEEKGLQLERSGEKKVIGQILVDQSHIRREITFLCLGLFGGARMIRGLTGLRAL